MSRKVVYQLAAFAILTVIGLVVMSTVYLNLPNRFGYDRTDFSLEMPDTGGLYESANVSYLGSTIGKVTAVKLEPGKVVAEMNVEASAGVPENVRAAVRSVSAIGEQYVDLIPEGEPQGELEDGTIIAQDKVSMPQGIGPVLDQANTLLNTIDDAKMRSVISEAFNAFNGTDRQLQELLDSTRLFLQEAQNNSEVTTQLIDDAEPFLNAQVRSGEDIRAWTRNMAAVTEQLRESEPQVVSLLERGPESLDRVTYALEELKPTMPVLVANLVSLGEVGVIYNRSIEQILVLYPALISSLMTAIDGAKEDGEIKVDFNLQINRTPPCTTGFIPAADRRSPADYTIPPIINDLYCKVPADSQIAPRGARNLPCMEFPGRRGASPQQCREGGYGPQHVMGENPPAPTDMGPPDRGLHMPGDDPPPGGHGDEGYGGDTAASPPLRTPYAAPAGMTTTAAVYDPETGEYVADDGRVYRQSDLAAETRVPAGATLSEVMTNGVAPR